MCRRDEEATKAERNGLRVLQYRGGTEPCRELHDGEWCVNLLESCANLLLLCGCLGDSALAGRSEAAALSMGSALQMQLCERACAWLKRNGLAPLLPDIP